MPVVTTHTMSPDHPDTAQLYNALDCCVTFEVWEALQSLFNAPPTIYAFERALQAPALEMMLRGFRVDKLERDRAVVALQKDIDQLTYVLGRMTTPICGRPINPRSGDQLRDLFYARMKIAPIWSSIKGERAVRMNRETLEKIEVYFHAQPIVATVLAIRDAYKVMESLTAGVDPDGRMRTSINVGATETGRFSSSKSTTGTGRNMFNVSERQRRMFVADPGYKICGIDLEQAESREVGWICWILFGDSSYLDACEAGDLHTHTASMVWDDLGWTGDPTRNREIAEQLYYRDYSYRYMAKRGGHATNYLTTPYTASRHLKCPIGLMERFQKRYMDAYPCIPRWHQWVAEQIQTTHQLTTTFDRQRHFFGRTDDDATLREAVAHQPQSQTADRLNIGLLRFWTHFGTRVQILLQLYDAIYFQYREDDNEAEIIQEALKLIDVPLEHNGRRFTVPGEAKVGWNWAPYVSEEDVKKAKGKPPELNLDGLKKWKGSDSRKRTAFLDQIM